MQVRVQFYSHLRDLAGANEMSVDMPESATVSDLLEKIYAAKPALRPADKTALVAAGVEFVARTYRLNSGEEISVMPPVQGG
jgi:molybdopterin synthase catalytic subunit